MNILRWFIVMFSFMLPVITNASSWDSPIYNDGAGIVYLGGGRLSSAMELVDKIDAGSVRMKFSNLYAINIHTNEVKVLFAAKSGKQYINEFEIGFQGNIAITVINDTSGTENIVLLDKNSNIITNIHGFVAYANIFSMSKSLNKLVYIKGRESIENDLPFYPEGVWIYDIEKRIEEEIFEVAHKVVWSKHDNNIYIDRTLRGDDRPVIYMYDTMKKTIVPSRYPSTSYSPNGEYYHDFEEHDEERSDLVNGEELRHISSVRSDLIQSTTDNSIKYMFDKNTIPGEIVFFPDARHLIKIYRSDNAFEVHDYMNGSRKREVSYSASLLGWNEDMTRAVVYVGKDTVQIQNMLTGQVLKSFKLPK